MIIPDINLLLYAHIDAFSQHDATHSWWVTCLGGREDIGLVPPVLFGFIRLATSRRVFDRPMHPDAALRAVEAMMARPNVHALTAGPRHLEIAFALLRSLGTAANLTSDAQIAAFAIEHQATLCSNDADFARFLGLRWMNPLAG